MFIEWLLYIQWYWIAGFIYLSLSFIRPFVISIIVGVHLLHYVADIFIKLMLINIYHAVTLALVFLLSQLRYSSPKALITSKIELIVTQVILIFN